MHDACMTLNLAALAFTKAQWKVNQQQDHVHAPVHVQSCQIWHGVLRPAARLRAHVERRCLHLKAAVHGVQATSHTHSLPVWQV